MREIKFRAWDSVKNEWFDDNFILAPTSPDWSPFPYSDSSFLDKYKKIIHEKIGCIDSDWKCELLGFISSDYSVFDWANFYFNNLIVEQYTGLKDKNGVEIYEGDIVESNQWSPKTYQVGFDRGGFCFFNVGDNYYTDAKYLEDFKVIGNMHENPDLLNDA